MYEKNEKKLREDMAKDQGKSKVVLGPDSYDRNKILISQLISQFITFESKQKFPETQNMDRLADHFSNSLAGQGLTSACKDQAKIEFGKPETQQRVVAAILDQVAIKKVDVSLTAAVSSVAKSSVVMPEATVKKDEKDDHKVSAGVSMTRK